MDTLMLVNIGLIWIVLVINLVLTLSLVRRINASANNEEHLQPELLEVGQLVPDFTLTNLQGQVKQLIDFAKRELVLVFISPTCEPCKAKMPELAGLVSRAAHAGTELVLVSLGDVDETVKFIEPYDIRTDVLVTAYGSKFVEDYKVPGTPERRVVVRDLAQSGGHRGTRVRGRHGGNSDFTAMQH